MELIKGGIKLRPVQIDAVEGEVSEICFDITLIVDRDGILQVIDNSVEDWRDSTDCGTILVKDLKLRP